MQMLSRLVQIYFCLVSNLVVIRGLSVESLSLLDVLRVQFKTKVIKTVKGRIEKWYGRP